MVARCVASDCRSQMRQEVRFLKIPSIEPLRKIALTLLNEIIFSDDYWRSTILPLIEEKFYRILPPSFQLEELSSFVIRPTKPMDIQFLVKRINSLTGIKMNQTTVDDFRNEILELVESDIQSITTRVKFMNIIEFSSGATFLIFT